MQNLIRRICYCDIIMTMYCPNCGALMVWKNGSILHDHPTKKYECGYCEIIVTRYVDGKYEIIRPNADAYRDKKSSRLKKMLHVR